MDTAYIIATVALSVFVVVAIAAAIWGGVRHSKTKRKRKEIEEYYRDPAPLSYDYYDASSGDESPSPDSKARDDEIIGNYKPD